MNETLLAALIERQKGTLPEFLGIEWVEITHGHARGRLEVEGMHRAPNGFLHAATVIALADTACGYGCVSSLPPGADGFTTVELKSNFLGTAQVGQVIEAVASLVHGGRSTQVWDATVTNLDTGKAIALFRCTQMPLYPKPHHG